MPNAICTELASKYTNKILRTVTNVYQLQYIDFKASGLGDYIRGCFCMTQLLNLLNKYCNADVNFDMDLRNHPMSKFIITNNEASDVDYKSLGNFHIDVLVVKDDEEDIAFQHILRETVNYMNKIKVPNFNAFCCKFAVFDKILEKDKELIRSKLVPNEILETYINSVMTELGLVKGGYQVIHIRCRDEISFPPINLTGSKFLSLIDENLAKHTNSDSKYLLVTNHDGLKQYLIGSRPNFISKKTEICHAGQDTLQTDVQIRDTLLDFFLLSKSGGITAFTPYGISGFSLECSKLYDIPYKVVPYTHMV